MSEKNLKQKKYRKKVYKITDQLIKVMLDPAYDIDTEMLLYYIKSKIKKK
jgi:hypothetical protein